MSIKKTQKNIEIIVSNLIPYTKETIEHIKYKSLKDYIFEYIKKPENISILKKFIEESSFNPRLMKEIQKFIL